MMNTIEEIKEFFRSEIVKNNNLLNNATYEYLHLLESTFGIAEKDLSASQIEKINETRDVYRDLMKESEVLDYLTYEMFIKDVNVDEKDKNK